MVRLRDRKGKSRALIERIADAIEKLRNLGSMFGAGCGACGGAGVQQK
jgi:hypothetical protein